MSDEPHFHLDGIVNRQNCRYYASENLQNFHEQTNTRSQNNSLVCRCKEINHQPLILGQGNTVTVNSVSYIENMRNNFSKPELRRMM